MGTFQKFWGWGTETFILLASGQSIKHKHLVTWLLDTIQ